MGNAESLPQGDGNNNNFIQSSNLKLQGLLGEGSIGGVYRAELTTGNDVHIVAAKKLKYAQFKNIDINYLCGIRHKNVVSYLGLVTDIKPPMMAMELGVNGSLYDYLRKQRPKGRLSAIQAGTWMSQVAGAVKFIQSLRNIEAEVKSPNFMIFAENQLKLGDFHPPSSQTLSSNPPEQKIKWMAPEMYKEKQRFPKSDVFSCGIVFWEILTCEPPFEGMSRGDVQYKVAGTQQLRPEIPSDCGDALRQLLVDCWRQAPASRPDIAAVKSRVKDIVAKGCKISTKLEPVHDVQTNPTPTAMCCYAPNKRPSLLAVSTRGGKKKAAIEVYDINAVNSAPVYTLESPDWGTPPIDVAATRGMILVICYRGKYVYQFQKYKSAAQESQKFEIADSMSFRYPRCIAVNQLCAVVGVEEKGESFPGSLVVFSVPTMQRERQIDLRYIPQGLDMNDVTSNFILVMGANQFSVRNIAEDAGRELSHVSAPSGTEFFSSVFELGSLSLRDRVQGGNQTSTDPPKVYAVVCTGSASDDGASDDMKNQNYTKGKRLSGDRHQRVSEVHHYRWDAMSKTYVDNGVVLPGLGMIGRNGFRLTRDGVCAVSEPNGRKLKIFNRK
ncbi:uncharacterized protein [Amphiura filiformis]|uniref:uncharacterized protein n=1 Tax=Amphiura filiformis TaxID=82378 RepID=UPI003B21AFDD